VRAEEGPDDKILAVTIADPRFEEIDDISDVQGHCLKDTEDFLNIYKTPEDNEMSMMGWGNAHEAEAIIEKCQTVI